MAVIKLQSNFIEFPFQNDKGETVLTLKFDKTDANIKQLTKIFDELEKQKMELEKNEDASFDDVKVFLKQAVDATFGTGSFDKMFDLSPSTLIVLEYFYQMISGIFEEYNESKVQDKMNKYLQ